MTRVLFVDDQQQVLDSLRDALRPQRQAWEMLFASSGADALAELDRAPCDVVVSDMRMPGMDGATLLGKIEQSHPTAIRIVLSGSTEREVVMRAAAVAHRLLAKPCDVDELVRVLARSCSLRAVTGERDAGEAPIAASRLPAAPRLHRDSPRCDRGLRPRPAATPLLAGRPCGARAEKGRMAKGASARRRLARLAGGGAARRNARGRGIIELILPRRYRAHDTGDAPGA